MNEKENFSSPRTSPTNKSDRKEQKERIHVCICVGNLLSRFESVSFSEANFEPRRMRFLAARFAICREEGDEEEEEANLILRRAAESTIDRDSPRGARE